MVSQAFFSDFYNPTRILKSPEECTLFQYSTNLCIMLFERTDCLSQRTIIRNRVSFIAWGGGGGAGGGGGGGGQRITRSLGETERDLSSLNEYN